MIINDNNCLSPLTKDNNQNQQQNELDNKCINYQSFTPTKMTSLNKINSDGQNYYITVLIGQQEMQINLSQYLEQEFKKNHNFVNYPPEQYYGNIEYKLKIIQVDQRKMEHRTTQMQFRLDEGKGLAYYYVGVEDDGTPTGIKQNEMQQSIEWLIKFATKNKAEMILTKIHSGKNKNQKIVEFMIRRKLQDSIKTDIRVIILGQKNSGKSSLIGMITTGQSNIGRQQFGRIFRQVVGFDSKGKVVNKINLLGQDNEDEYIYENATKIITFIDLLETVKQNQNEAMQNIQSQFPNYFLLVISAIQPLEIEFQQQLTLISTQQIPIFIVITHADKLNEEYQLEILLSDIRNKIKSIAKQTPVIMVRSTQDLILFSKQIIEQYEKETIIPVFLLSNLDVKSHQLFIQFLNQLPLKNELITNSSQPVEFGIHQTFELQPYKLENDKQDQDFLSFFADDTQQNNKKSSVDILEQEKKILILGGTVTKGIIKVGQTLLLGPDKNGNFYPIQVSNIQSNRVKVKSVLSGQLCTIQFDVIMKQYQIGTSQNPIRKGMVLVDHRLKPQSYRDFEVNIQFFQSKGGLRQLQEEFDQQNLREKICLSKTHEVVVHTPYSKQTCQILFNLDQDEIQENDLFNELPLLTKKLSKSVDNRDNYKQSQKLIETTQNQKKKIKNQQKNNTIEIQSGEILKLKFRFKYQREYLTQGMKIIIMEQKFQAFGHIVQVFI